MVGLYFPTWLVSEQGRPDSALAVTEAAAGAAVVFLAPWVGARSDFRRRRLPALMLTTGVAVVATAFLATLPPAGSLVIFGIALVGFNVGSVVYDALLPTVSEPQERGRVSGLGVGVGYVGSFIGLAIGTLVLDVWEAGYPAVFVSLAAGFLLFSVPAFAWVREPPTPPPDGAPPSVTKIVTRLVASWRATSRYPGLTRFLLGRFLYTDAINTLIGGFLAIFAQTELGLDRAETRTLLGVAIVASIAGGLLGSRLVDQVGAARYLRTVLLVWVASLATGVAAAVSGQRGLVWLVGAAGGVALGGTWSSDRVLMTRLSPPERLGEFYGLYATVGRFATVLGPLTWALVAETLGLGRRAALAALGLFVALAWVVLRPLKELTSRKGPDLPARR